jgi:hypothetical protein
MSEIPTARLPTLTQAARVSLVGLLAPHLDRLLLGSAWGELGLLCLLLHSTSISVFSGKSRLDFAFLHAILWV